MKKPFLDRFSLSSILAGVEGLSLPLLLFLCSWILVLQNSFGEITPSNDLTDLREKLEAALQVPHLITAGEYTFFLNSVAVHDSAELYLGIFADSFIDFSIKQVEESGGYRYELEGEPSLPMVGVPLIAQLYFCNWCEAGFPQLIEGYESLEQGAYNIPAIEAGGEISLEEGSHYQLIVSLDNGQSLWKSSSNNSFEIYPTGVTQNRDESTVALSPQLQAAAPQKKEGYWSNPWIDVGIAVASLASFAAIGEGGRYYTRYYSDYYTQEAGGRDWSFSPEARNQSSTLSSLTWNPEQEAMMNSSNTSRSVPEVSSCFSTVSGINEVSQDFMMQWINTGNTSFSTKAMDTQKRQQISRRNQFASLAFRKRTLFCSSSIENLSEGLEDILGYPDLISLIKNYGHDFQNGSTLFGASHMLSLLNNRALIEKLNDGREELTDEEIAAANNSYYNQLVALSGQSGQLPIFKKVHCLQQKVNQIRSAFQMLKSIEKNNPILKLRQFQEQLPPIVTPKEGSLRSIFRDFLQDYPELVAIQDHRSLYQENCWAIIHMLFDEEIDRIGRNNLIPSPNQKAALGALIRASWELGGATLYEKQSASNPRLCLLLRDQLLWEAKHFLVIAYLLFEREQTLQMISLLLDKDQPTLAKDWQHLEVDFFLMTEPYLEMIQALKKEEESFYDPNLKGREMNAPLNISRSVTSASLLEGKNQQLQLLLERKEALHQLLELTLSSCPDDLPQSGAAGSDHDRMIQIHYQQLVREIRDHYQLSQAVDRLHSSSTTSAKGEWRSIWSMEKPLSLKALEELRESFHELTLRRESLINLMKGPSFSSQGDDAWEILDFAPRHPGSSTMGDIEESKELLSTTSEDLAANQEKLLQAIIEQRLKIAIQLYHTPQVLRLPEFQPHGYNSITPSEIWLSPAKERYDKQQKIVQDIEEKKAHYEKKQAAPLTKNGEEASDILSRAFESHDSLIGEEEEIEEEFKEAIEEIEGIRSSLYSTYLEEGRQKALQIYDQYVSPATNGLEGIKANLYQRFWSSEE